MICYVSKSSAGELFAIYFPGVLRDGESDRHVALHIDPEHVRFTDKGGNPLDIPRESGRFRIPLHVDGYGKPVYVWAKNLSLGEFRTQLAGAAPSAHRPEIKEGANNSGNGAGQPCRSRT